MWRMVPGYPYSKSLMQIPHTCSQEPEVHWMPSDSVGHQSVGDRNGMVLVQYNTASFKITTPFSTFRCPFVHGSRCSDQAHAPGPPRLSCWREPRGAPASRRLSAIAEGFVVLKQHMQKPWVESPIAAIASAKDSLFTSSASCHSGSILPYSAMSRQEALFRLPHEMKIL